MRLLNHSRMLSSIINHYDNIYNKRYMYAQINLLICLKKKIATSRNVAIRNFFDKNILKNISQSEHLNTT